MKLAERRKTYRTSLWWLSHSGVRTVEDYEKEEFEDKSSTQKDVHSATSTTASVKTLEQVLARFKAFMIFN